MSERLYQARCAYIFHMVYNMLWAIEAPLGTGEERHGNG